MRSPPACFVLHHIAFAVVSEWCQEDVDYVSPVRLRIMSVALTLRRSAWETWRLYQKVNRRLYQKVNRFSYSLLVRQPLVIASMKFSL
jgi:hypothetical protein